MQNTKKDAGCKKQSFSLPVYPSGKIQKKVTSCEFQVASEERIKTNCKLQKQSAGRPVCQSSSRENTKEADSYRCKIKRQVRVSSFKLQDAKTVCQSSGCRSGYKYKIIQLTNPPIYQLTN